MRFNAAHRERLLALIEAGYSVERACSDTGIGRATVTRWVAAGSEPDASAEAREFSRRYAELRRARRRGSGNGGNGHAPLSDEELLAVLEGAASRGSAEAAQTVLARRRREQRAREEADPEEPHIDAMTWLRPAEMAALTEEQRQRARELYVAECDARPASWESEEEWQRERALILSGEWDVLPAEPVEVRRARASKPHGGGR